MDNHGEDVRSNVTAAEKRRESLRATWIVQASAPLMTALIRLPICLEQYLGKFQTEVLGIAPENAYWRPQHEGKTSLSFGTRDELFGAIRKDGQSFPEFQLAELEDLIAPPAWSPQKWTSSIAFDLFRSASLTNKLEVEYKLLPRRRVIKLCDELEKCHARLQKWFEWIYAATDIAAQEELLEWDEQELSESDENCENTIDANMRDNFASAGFSPKELRGRLDVSPESLNRYARKAKVQTPGIGRVGHRYSVIEAIQICETAIRVSPVEVIKKRALEFLADLEKIRQSAQ